MTLEADQTDEKRRRKKNYNEQIEPIDWDLLLEVVPSCASPNTASALEKRKHFSSLSLATAVNCH